MFCPRSQITLAFTFIRLNETALWWADFVCIRTIARRDSIQQNVACARRTVIRELSAVIQVRYIQPHYTCNLHAINHKIFKRLQWLHAPPHANNCWALVWKGATTIWSEQRQPTVPSKRSVARLYFRFLEVRETKWNGHTRIGWWAQTNMSPIYSAFTYNW